MLGQGCLGELCLGEMSQSNRRVLLDAARGAYSLTGIAAVVTSARSIVCAVRAFTLTGTDTGVRTGLGIAVATGHYAVTAPAMVLNRTVAAASKFVHRVSNYRLRNTRGYRSTLEE